MADTVAQLLGKEDVQSILETASEQPMSISDLSEKCDIPLSSTYHHAEQLVAEDLLRVHSQLDSSGNHYRTYETAFRGCFIYLDDGTIQEDVCFEEDHASRLIWAWKQLRSAK